MKPYSDIQNLIKNKTVAIVGNAESLLSKEDGIMIDGFQVVIRMNFGFVYAPLLLRQLVKSTAYDNPKKSTMVTPNRSTLL